MMTRLDSFAEGTSLGGLKIFARRECLKADFSLEGTSYPSHTEITRAGSHRSASVRVCFAGVLPSYDQSNIDLIGK
jgi:hypothetical protein